MPIGVITNCMAVFLGGLLGGTVLRKITPWYLKQNLPFMFGLCSIGIAVNSLVKAHNMSAVVLAVLVGFSVGQVFHLHEKTTRFFAWLVETLHLGGKEVDMGVYITMVALFCCSGFGWYGAMNEGITGDASLLMSKAVLDFFTAAVFATGLGVSLCAIPLPQIFIFLAVFGISKFVAPGNDRRSFGLRRCAHAGGGAACGEDHRCPHCGYDARPDSGDAPQPAVDFTAGLKKMCAARRGVL